MKQREIRADYDERTIVVYQAYQPEIAEAAVRHNRFVPPFSLNRMTWIKPSFLWMMERSNWARKPGQERVLAVRITRAGWEEALAQGVLTSFEPRVYRSFDEWRKQMDVASVRVQWDPERDLYGKSLEHRSIQVGVSQQVVQQYVDEWSVEIRDVTPLVSKLSALISSGHADRARDLLPRKRLYPVPEGIARRLGME